MIAWHTDSSLDSILYSPIDHLRIMMDSAKHDLCDFSYHFPKFRKKNNTFKSRKDT